MNKRQKKEERQQSLGAVHTHTHTHTHTGYLEKNNLKKYL